MDRGHTGTQCRGEVAGCTGRECLRKHLRGKGHSPGRGDELQEEWTSEARTLRGPECASKSEGITWRPANVSRA